MKPILFLMVSLPLLFLDSCTMESKPPESQEAYIPLLFGAVKPSGWLRDQMERDMEGFTGNLDLIVPELVNDPIYSSGRLHSKSKARELGNLKAGDTGDDEQYKWWNSETQSNWWDGYIRNALLLGSEDYLKKASEQISGMLATQDEDGYLGIYTPDTRYRFTSENGELWAKATLMRYLLAWFEASGDEIVWKALLKAVENSMTNYPPYASDPFNVGESYSGGTAHGLVFTDVLERLCQLTGDKKYSRYALFLYRNYSENFSHESDAQLKNILDPDYRLKCHGVHTYEHLRPVIMAEFASEELAKQHLIDNYLQKIAKTTTQTGGAIGDEWIGERYADAENSGYEYCSLHELLDSYTFLVQKRGDQGLGNSIENIFYNAAMGARHPSHSLIAYLKTDNSYEMTGTKNGEKEQHPQTRYKYSPAHQDAAVCCVPNAGRITPYFIRHSWMKKGKNTLVANLLMPNILETTVGKSNLKIENETRYPFSNEMLFKVTVSSPVKLKIMIRKPEWATGVSSEMSFRSEGEFLVFEKKFSGSEIIPVSFDTGVRVLKSQSGEHYFAFGALIYARPIEAEEIRGREYTSGFADLYYKGTDSRRYLFEEEHQATFDNGKIVVTLKNRETAIPERVTLVPLSGTILRQAAF